MSTRSKPYTVADYGPAQLPQRYGIDNQARLPGDPEIGWQYDEQSHKARCALEDHVRVAQQTIPSHWPQPTSHPLAWTAGDLQSHEYTRQLTDADILELEHCLPISRGKFNVLPATTRRGGHPLEDGFNGCHNLLPALGTWLEEIRSNLHDGVGLHLIRGLDGEKYTLTEKARIFIGIAKKLGFEVGRQNMAGAKIYHIMDVTALKGHKQRPVFSNDGVPFHTDVICGILGLYYISIAQMGGELSLSSSWRVYNELASTQPDVLHVLSQEDWPFDTFGQQPPYYKRAILHFSAGRPVLNFSRRLLTGSDATPRTPGIPALTSAQANALDAVHACASKHALKIDIRPGDMVFVNNMALMHARANFHDSVHNSRHALRLWLRDIERGWPVPRGLMPEWERTFEDFDHISDHWSVDSMEEAVEWSMKSAESSSSCG